MHRGKLLKLRTFKERAITILPFAAVAVLLWLSVYGILIYLRDGHEQRFLEEQSQMQKLAWRAATQVNEGLIEHAVESYVLDNETTLALLKRAHDPMQRDSAREALYAHLAPKNSKLLERGFRQFHFHLPDGESFLRFHRPEAYGDSLVGVRHSVEVANRELRPVFGFEAGRLYSGFRSVFPIVNDKGEHLGSVELSMPFEAVHTRIAQLLESWEFAFVVDADQHHQTLFESQRHLFAPWPLHSDFWMEDPNATLPDAAAPLSADRSCLLEAFKDHPDLHTLLDSRSSGALTLKQSSGYGVLTLTAITDTQGQNAGFLIGLSHSDEPAFLDRSVAFGLTLSAMLFALLAISGGWLAQNRQSIKTAKVELERALKAEQHFIASMSHEMRTPLNSIIGYQELLLSLPLDRDALRYVKRANLSAEHLLALIADILDLSKLQAGGLELRKEPVEIAELLKECQSIIAPNLQPGVTLEIMGSRAPCRVEADAMRLKQILLNLLSNAAKFTPEGAITIRYAVRDEAPDPCRVRIDVVDTGVGIHPDRLDELFSPFKRAHTDRYSGSGLGLYISRRLAQQMGGTLTVRSQEHQGSTFTLTLPCLDRTEP